MTETEHLLSCLMEECAEVSQRCSKANRFGLDEIQPGQELTNAERIIVEYIDLVAVIEMLKDRGIFSKFPYLNSIPMINAKKSKVTKYMEYARSVGTLT